MDGTVNGSYVSITMNDMYLRGGFFDFKGRMVFNSFLAMNGELGIGLLAGKMPGIGPITPIPTGTGFYYNIRIDGKSSLSFINMRPTINLEVQPVRTQFLSLIVFGGINFSFSRFNITTPYSLVWGTDVYPGYTDTLSITSSLLGGQCGVHVDIPLGDTIRLSPFMMVTSFSGTATLTDDPGASGVSETSYSADIPSSTSYSIGMDIIFGDISIGTVLQQLQSSKQDNKDTRVIMISAGYHFSSGGGQEQEEQSDVDQTIEESESDPVE